MCYQFVQCEFILNFELCFSFKWLSASWVVRLILLKLVDVRLNWSCHFEISLKKKKELISKMSLSNKMPWSKGSVHTLIWSLDHKTSQNSKQKIHPKTKVDHHPLTTTGSPSSPLDIELESSLILSAASSVWRRRWHRRLRRSLCCHSLLPSFPLLYFTFTTTN